MALKKQRNVLSFTEIAAQVVFKISEGNINMVYADRYEAGSRLAEKLLQYKGQNTVVLALPRGGVVLGYEVAKALNAPLDVFVARKIGAPFYPELGIGAIAPNGIQILDSGLIKSLGIEREDIEKVVERETAEMQRRLELYRGDSPPINLDGKTVILIDDGLATGVTARAAVLSVKKMRPNKIILAAPVSPPSTAERFRQEVDEFICLEEPLDFYAVGAYYSDFSQISDMEVIDLINKAKKGFDS